MDLGDKYNRNQVLYYIAMVYDRCSGIRRKYPDVNQRKFEALNAAKFKYKENVGFGTYVDHMIEGGVDEINSMIVSYVRLANSTKFSMLITAESIFYSYLKKSLSGVTTIKADELNKFETMLMDAQREVLAEDNNKGLTQTLYRKINTVVDYSPEWVSQRIAEKGVDNIFND